MKNRHCIIGIVFSLFFLFVQTVFSEEFFRVPDVSWMDTQSRFTEITLEMMKKIYDEDYEDENFGIFYGGVAFPIVGYPVLPVKNYSYDYRLDGRVSDVRIYETTTDRHLWNPSIDAMYFSRFKYMSFAINWLQGLPYITGDDGLPYECILNMGLAFTSSYGSLGGYIGIDHRKDYKLEDTMYGLKLNYWIVPSLGLNKYPVIGYIFKTLIGHINIMEASVKGYSGRLATQSFDIGKITISAMDYYYKKEPFNSEASHEIYGARIGINDVILIDGGYQKYFDIPEFPISNNDNGLKETEMTGLDSYYKDSLFLKLAYSWIKTDGAFDFTKTTLICDWSSRYSPFPKLGLDIEAGTGSTLLKFTLGFFLSKGLIEFNIGFVCTWIGEYR